MMKSKEYLTLPHNCYLILTNNCNMRCLHCYGNYGTDIPNNELSGKEWIKIIENLAKENVFFFNISGGEPTTHPDFNMIIDALIEHEVYFMLTTNGVCSQNKLDSILKAKDFILGIQLSLDGPDWASHGYIRKDINGESKKSLYDKALNSAKQFIKHGIRTSIATCIHNANINKMDSFKDMIMDLRPSHWAIGTISISGRAKEHDNLFVSEATLPLNFWKQLKDDCNARNISVDFIDMPNITKTKKDGMIYFECPAAKWFCEINSDGLTTPCPLARVNPPKSIGKWDNIRDKNIHEIWTGENFNIFRKYQKMGCSGCKAKEKCDRCPPQSVQWFDDPLMPPPYCIINGEKLGLDNLDRLTSKLEKAKKINNREQYGIKEVSR